MNKKFFLFVVVIISLVVAVSAEAATITVDANADTMVSDGNCTLREALTNANSDTDTTSGDCVAGSGTDTIEFSESMDIVLVGTSLQVTSPVIIDGTANGLGTCTTKNLGVQIDASGLDTFNFHVTGSNATIKGIVMKGNLSNTSIIYSSGLNNTFACNIIGYESDGITGAPSQDGIIINGGDNTMIGGANLGDGNIINAREASMIYLQNTSGTTIWGNYIGIGLDGTTWTGTAQTGVIVQDSTDTIIGGNTSAKRNVIGGLQGGVYPSGILVQGVSDNVIIQGNYIGTDSTGNVAAPIKYVGITSCGPHTCGQNPLDASTNITIGGINPGEGNVIAGTDDASGMYITATGVIIQGNKIGVGADGSTPLGNGQGGISITDSSDVIIGGSTAGARNIISNNMGSGIRLEDGVLPTTNVTIAGNYIGINADGTTAAGNQESGIITFGEVSGLVIGGSLEGARNVIADNDDAGIYLRQGISDVVIKNNYIGVGADGVTSMFNAEGALRAIGGSDLTVGGTGEYESNVLVGSTDDNAPVVYLEDWNDAHFVNNYINIGADETSVYGNGDHTVFSMQLSNNITIGGLESERNYFGTIAPGAYVPMISLIGGNLLLKNNYIGILPDGITSAVPGGVLSSIFAVGNATIMDNIIAFALQGIAAAGLDMTVTSSNNTFRNVGLPFDLLTLDGWIPTDTGLNRNDYLDNDVGVNGFINHPVMISASQSGSDIAATYMLDVPVSEHPYRVEFYTGLGELYEGFENVSITTPGHRIITTSVSDSSIAEGLSATVTPCTDEGCTTFGGTSEFSNKVGASSGGIDRGTAQGNETDFSDNGAYHIIGDAWLGACINADTVTKNDTQGTGGCIDDRDGVVFTKRKYKTSEAISFTVNPTDAGYMNVFIDRDQDGAFDGSGEHVIVNNAVVAGEQEVLLPITFSEEGTYSARFRYSTINQSDLTSTGEALDGEVEDYTILIENPRVIGYDSRFSKTETQGTNQLSTAEILGSGQCPANLIINDSMRQGDRNGNYSTYNKKAVTEVKLLQSHINRILKAQYNQAAGPEDGIFGPLTKQGVMRLQTALNTILKPTPTLIIDGIVGPFTRSAINTSCGI
jgi:hypothetical protein